VRHVWRHETRQQPHEIAGRSTIAGNAAIGHFYMRLPDSSDGYDRWLELAEVPVPDDVPSDGRGVCGACYELAGAS
jgi:hypothetical protein